MGKSILFAKVCSLNLCKILIYFQLAVAASSECSWLLSYI